jgi:uncharacterized OsmC-like protein
MTTATFPPEIAHLINSDVHPDLASQRDSFTLGSTVPLEVHNQWFNGLHSRSQIVRDMPVSSESAERPTGIIMESDNPIAFGGTDTGAHPIEYAMHALTSCLTASIALSAVEAGIPVDSIESQLVSHLDSSWFTGHEGQNGVGHQTVRIAFTIDSSAPREKVEEMFHVAVRKSPLLELFNNQISIIAGLAD